MNVTGYPTSVTQIRLQGFAADISERLDDSRIEAVTGRFADITQAIGGDVGRVHLLEKQISDADERLEQIGLLKADFAFAQNTLGSIGGAATNLAIELEAANGVNNEESLKALEQEFETELRLAFSQLNASAGGRQIFSGASTDTPPLANVDEFIADIEAIVDSATDAADIDALLDDYFAGVGGTNFDASIYQGSTLAAPDREVSATKRLGVDIRADDQAFKDVFRGYASFIAVRRDPDLTDEDKSALYSSASTKLREGAEGVINARTRLGAAEGAVNTAETRLNAEKLTYQEIYNQLTSVDQFEAASLVTNLETQLQTIYLTTARISGLSLVNFL